MASSYTIDIQLTELGFPDFFRNEEPVSQDVCNNLTTELARPTITGEDAFRILKTCRDNQSNVSNSSNNEETNKKIRHGATQCISVDACSTGTASSHVGEQTSDPNPSTKSQSDTYAEKQHKSKRDQESGTETEETDNSDVSEDEEEMEYSGLPDDSTRHGCNVCGQSLPSASSLEDHMRLHSATRPYHCAECGKQFRHLANYCAHLDGHAQAVHIRCRICEATFKSEESLQLHLETSHLQKEFYQCDYCKRIFTCLKECHHHVELHKRGVTRHQCPHCAEYFEDQRSFLRHVSRHRCRTFHCTECGQVFSKKNVLLRHSFSHLGLLPYTCIRCRRHFRLASLYRKHSCEPEKVQCVACLGFFRSQKDFQKHKEETGCWGHQGAKGDQIRCMECGQAFDTAEDLKKHGGAHQRVLTCSECGKGFRSSLLLMSHMRGHASQRPCLCQRCGLGFLHQQAYEIHKDNCGTSSHSAVTKKQKKETQLATEEASESSEKKKSQGASDGVWQLTLNNELPPGATLVVFVPPSTDSEPLGPTLTKALPAEAVMGTTIPSLLPNSPLSNKFDLDKPSGQLNQVVPDTQVEAATTKCINTQMTKISDDPLTTSSTLSQPIISTVATESPIVSEILQTSAQVCQAGMEVEEHVVGDAQTGSLRMGLLDEAGVGQLENPWMIKIEDTSQKESELDVMEGETEIESQQEKNPEETKGILTDHDYFTFEMSRKCKEEDFDMKASLDVEGKLDSCEKPSVDFNSVEVELCDGAEDMQDEPHECINCGRILLDGNLLEHYMQHAMESDGFFRVQTTRSKRLY